MKAKGYSATAIGGREVNQDAFYVNNERQIYAVADGVGGGARGEVASQMAVKALEDHPEDGTRLKTTVEITQAAVLKEALDSLGEALMGTTLTICQVTGHYADLCHVGDSRFYLFANDCLKQMSEGIPK